MLNIAVVLCIFIVLAGVIAYTWEEKREIVAKKEASIDEALLEISPHVEQVQSKLSTLQSSLATCKEKISSSNAKIPSSISEKVDVLQKLEERLVSRVFSLQELLDSKDVEKFDEIPSLAQSEVVFKNDAESTLTVSYTHLTLPTILRV